MKKGKKGEPKRVQSLLDSGFEGRKREDSGQRGKDKGHGNKGRRRNGGTS